MSNEINLIKGQFFNKSVMLAQIVPLPCIDEIMSERKIS